MALKLSVAPDVQPITLSEAKAHLRIDNDDEDSLINLYIQAAAQWVEGYTLRKLITQTWELTLDAFPITAPHSILLPWGRCTAINYINYVDDNGNTQQLTGPTSSPAGSDYQENLNSDEGGLTQPLDGDDWPSTDEDTLAAVAVNYDVGYGATPDLVPADLRAGVLYRLTDLYEFRGTIDLLGAAAATRGSIMGNGTGAAIEQIAGYRLRRW